MKNNLALENKNNIDSVYSAQSYQLLNFIFFRFINIKENVDEYIRKLDKLITANTFEKFI